MEFFKCSVGGVSYGTGLTEIAITKYKREGEAPPPIDITPLPNTDVCTHILIITHPYFSLQLAWIYFQR